MTGQEGHKQHKDWDGNKKNFTTMQHNNLRQRDIEVEENSGDSCISFICLLVSMI